jgi:hypothetical protein
LAAFEVDPMLAAEMIARSTDVVWTRVGSTIQMLAVRWHTPGKIDRAPRFTERGSGSRRFNRLFDQGLLAPPGYIAPAVEMLVLRGVAAVVLVWFPLSESCGRGDPPGQSPSTMRMSPRALVETDRSAACCGSPIGRWGACKYLYTYRLNR